MNIVIMSLWRNDEHRQIHARVDHLLSKGSLRGEVSWLWMVGDSTDNTYEILTRKVHECGLHDRVAIGDMTTTPVGEDSATRRVRGSITASVMFSAIDPDADYVVLHESDLVSEPHVVDQLLRSSATVDYSPMAGWPTIEITPGHPQFYDVWAYRDLRGRQFSPRTNLRGRITEVGSFGSVWLAPAAMVIDRIIEKLAIAELCQQWRNEGHHLFVDPNIAIEQPTDLWEACT